MIDDDCFKCGSNIVIHCDACNEVPDDCSCDKDEYRGISIDSDKNISEGIKLLE